MDDGIFAFGINAATGTPLATPGEAAVRRWLDEEPVRLQPAQKARGLAPEAGAFALTSELSPDELAEAGWAVLFGPDATPEIKEALRPLIERRKAEAARDDPRLFQIFEDLRSYRPGDSAAAWLARWGITPNIVEPARGVPFYLLIVSAPDAIPFEFQYELDIFWAVGRLWFDAPEDFRRYADSVVAYETAASVATAREVALFAPTHDNDAATRSFVEQVATPMLAGDDINLPLGTRQKFGRRSLLGDHATRGALLDWFTRPDMAPPALLFSGGHGMCFDLGDPLQAGAQGALLCADWDPLAPPSPADWLAGSDLPAEARLHGIVHLLFACYGAGCPRDDNFRRLESEPVQIAPAPFVSRLPQALLAHPGGGALAVIGHVERAWSASFAGPRGKPQLQGFSAVLGSIMRGKRIGYALDDFSIKWTALSTRIAELQQEHMIGGDIDMATLRSLWLAADDARNYVVLGDPAVRLRVQEMPPVP